MSKRPVESSPAFRDAVTHRETPASPTQAAIRLKRLSGRVQDEEPQATHDTDASQSAEIFADAQDAQDAQPSLAFHQDWLYAQAGTGTEVLTDAGPSSVSASSVTTGIDTSTWVMGGLALVGVAAASSGGSSAAPAQATSDTTAPIFSSATTNSAGNKVILTYNEALHANTAAAGGFTVKVAGVDRAVTAVTVNGSTVELTLASAVTAGQTVTVAYAAPAADGSTSNAAVQDSAGNDAASLSATSVANNVSGGGYGSSGTPDTTPPVFSSPTTASVAENTTTATVVYDAQASENGGAMDAGITYSKSGADAALFTLDAATGVLKFIASPDYEAPLDAGGDNVYDVTITATDAAHNASSQAVAITVTNGSAPTSAQAFALWQTAETNATAGDINALNNHSAQIMLQRDTTSADGSANQADAAKCLAQYINQVTGTDIVSHAEYAAGFTITGHATAGAIGTIKFYLDNDRTDGVNQMGTQLADGVNGVHIAYNNTSGDYTITFDADSAALLPATHNSWGSGIHQLTVDTDGSGTQNGTGATLEASRLFLVADGTASSTDTGTVAQNYSVQDKVTNDVFVYYYGDPDGAGIGLWTVADNGDSASDQDLVATDRDSDPKGYSDWDYYSSAGNAAGTQATASNTALHLVTNVAAQTWEFHMATNTRWETWDVVNAQATDHTGFGSNTSRQASLAEAMALYAANFGDSAAGGHTVGAVQAMSNAGSTNSSYNAAENNQPGGWDYYMWTAAPTPSGHALLYLYDGHVIDNPRAFNVVVSAVL